MEFVDANSYLYLHEKHQNFVECGQWELSRRSVGLRTSSYLSRCFDELALAIKLWVFGSFHEVDVEFFQKQYKF